MRPSSLLSVSLELPLPKTQQNFSLKMKMSVLYKKLWSVHKQLILVLTPLVFLPLLFTLPEKVSDVRLNILCISSIFHTY